MLNQVVELKREVTAVQIPSGDVLTLPEGERVYITQILGGSYTVATDHGLARISRENADALGAGAEEPSPEAAALDENATLEERVWDLVMEAKDRIEALEGVEAADVEMVWDPPWNQDMVSEEGRMKLGLI